MKRVLPVVALLIALLSVASAGRGQTFREHARAERPQDAEVAGAQAQEITLTLVDVAKQSIQTWVRTAGSLDESRRRLTACIGPPDADLVEPGQRVRAFSPDSKSSVYQARVTGVTQGDGCKLVEAALSGPVYGDAPRYVMEIIVNRGEYVAIPNEAIIEREDSRVVYVEREPGRYQPQTIHAGLRGELYTEVHGLNEGDRVVTLGSFFIDADYRLKPSTVDATGAVQQQGDAHQHH